MKIFLRFSYFFKSMEGIQYKSLIIKLVDKQRFITENSCVTGSIPVGTT